MNFLNHPVVFVLSLYHRFMIFQYGFRIRRLMNKIRKELPSLDGYSDEQIIAGLKNLKQNVP